MKAIVNTNIKRSKGRNLTKGMEIEVLHLVGQKVALAQILINGKFEFNTTMSIAKKYFTFI